MIISSYEIEISERHYHFENNMYSFDEESLKIRE